MVAGLVFVLWQLKKRERAAHMVEDANMKEYLPHEIFISDFDELLEEAKRQENIDIHNRGEYAIAESIHTYFIHEVMPLVRQNDWVFESALKLATDHIDAYFMDLLLTGKQTYDNQKNLHILKKDVSTFVKKHASRELSGETVDLTKMSDFITVIELEKLNRRVREKAINLQERVKDHEEMQLNIILRSIRNLYEMGFPRIMYVLRRVMKVRQGLRPKDSDNTLLQPADYLAWYKDHSNVQHPFHAILGNTRITDFYKAARNVASHQQGLIWQPENDTVVLPDRRKTIKTHMRDFHQRYRYLIYLSDYGLRGIFSAFCEREHGEISDRLLEKYEKTFPIDFPVGETGKIKYYTK